jgi:hypothetical protein
VKRPDVHACMGDFEQLSPIAPHADALVFRELSTPAEIVAFLRLRHKVYFEERGLGVPKPYGLDLTAYDARSRMFGLFRGGALIGGSRIVLREPQAQAGALRALHAITGAGIEERSDGRFPSEEFFDVCGHTGLYPELIDFEPGRLVAERPGLGQGFLREVSIAVLAAAHLAGCRLYVYSASPEMCARYAPVTNPRWTIDQCRTDVFEADGFRMPRTSRAAVGVLYDSPFLARVIGYARELRSAGFARLTTAAQPELRS